MCDLVLWVVDGKVDKAVIHKELYHSSKWGCGWQVIDEQEKQQGPEDGPLRKSITNRCCIWKCSIHHDLLGSATQEVLDPSITAAVSAVVGELVKQSLMGGDIKCFGEVQNTNVRLQTFVVYGWQAMESKEEL